MWSTERIVELVEQVRARKERLILLVAPSGNGKTRVLRALERESSWTYVNLGLDLSRRLLDVERRWRPVRVRALCDDILGTARAAGAAGADGPLLLDNIEILFEPSLAIAPLPLLDQSARRATLIVAWPGRLIGDHLLYADPGHLEHHSYPRRGLCLITEEVTWVT